MRSLSAMPVLAATFLSGCTFGTACDLAVQPGIVVTVFDADSQPLPGASGYAFNQRGRTDFSDPPAAADNEADSLRRCRDLRGGRGKARLPLLAPGRCPRRRGQRHVPGGRDGGTGSHSPIITVTSRRRTSAMGQSTHGACVRTTS